jgi:isoleucyl-tRNA synthetase
MAQELKDTLQLPKTDFPMRANLVQREPARLAHWEKIDLYAAIQRQRANAPVFVLHDGPPFTNGDVHIGTALNKTLKDITLRYKSMRGFRTPYVPGWDCHGLPIEQKVTRELQEKKLTVTTSELRQQCDAFSERWIAKQAAQFRRLGVLADWKNEYKTKDPRFEADVLRTFAAFVEKGLVYRSKKPVYWSIPFETALAEAEIEYRNHVSPSIWVRFRVAESAVENIRKRCGPSLPAGKPWSIVIWTTTPWTIPANLAIAVNPKINYCVWENENECLVVAEQSPIFTELKLTGGKIHPLGPGELLEGIEARHPFIDRASPFVLADYVTIESGTGCVHTAPGHGAEDYLTGLKYKLEIYCPVGDDGRYLDDGRIPADMVGLTALETVEDIAAKRTSPANIAVLKKLTAAGALLAKQNLTHSYPHCWRSKTPIVFRAVDQWFVSLDKDGLRDEALRAIAGVQWVPTWGENRIRGAVESRPDWCISRQRAWGVPIPAFYDAQKKGYLDAGVIRAVADRVAERGTNFWFDATPAELLAGVKLPTGWPEPDALTAGRDTLDVWIDSGSTHIAVLKRGQGGTQWPADLYLEGSDQHRGWFQSSLWCGVIACGGAPYKAVLTHGFVVGEDGKKISKSGQYEKPPTAENYIAQFGADVIRQWVASQNFTEDITLSDKILNNASEAYRLIRNTLRYQISTLFDFDPARHTVSVEKMDTLDRWALHQTAQLLRACTEAYDAYEFHRVTQLCNQFCAGTLSQVYHDILKDRLYTLAADHPLRRSSQTAIYRIFDVLVKVLAPILSLTADEAWSFATAKQEFAPDSIHLQNWPVAPEAWTNAAIDGEVAELLRVRAIVNEALEPARQAGKIGKSLEAAVTLTCAADAEVFRVLEKHREFLPELFIVSQVILAPASGALQVDVRPCAESGHVRCPRCWRWVPALQGTEHGDVCPRCAEALR